MRKVYKFDNPVKRRVPIPLRPNRVKSSGKVYKRVKRVNPDKEI